MTPTGFIISLVLLGVLSFSRVNAQGPTIAPIPSPVPIADPSVAPISAPSVSPPVPGVAPSPPASGPAPSSGTPGPTPASPMAPAPGPNGQSAGVVLSPAVWTSFVVATLVVATMA
ncbi:hypothetical protein MPTK1_3g11120 [Marchantia polymorpha subsp. ruderalis]|uniref:Arabinogalactan protein n=2 Tax=Marchantia polymorpha TaxID=3197 RepID=A0AAF6AZL1_MARPO|nr:hypothetical protein MARPO_0037s0085 [Marchantia polymorpha]BBN05195.1 hypothetical protein Mp_3g11120 [Marchantia polymorpha subsp. ruderalis]|eukprot:PTQ40910.1 hypothetical protein MARPO_0037s0085 [Marchantia polymorpha]